MHLRASWKGWTTPFWAWYFPKGVQWLLRPEKAVGAPAVTWGGDTHQMSSATFSQHRVLLNFRSSFSNVSLIPTSTLSFLAKPAPTEKILKDRGPGIRDWLDGEVKKRKLLINGRLWHRFKKYLRIERLYFRKEKKNTRYFQVLNIYVCYGFVLFRAGDVLFIPVSQRLVSGTEKSYEQMFVVLIWMHL